MTHGQAVGERPDSGEAAPGSAIARLAQGASIETSTRNVADVAGYAPLVPAGTDVYVTFLPGTPYHHILSTATRLRQVGLDPVPHLAARRFASAAAVADFAARLRDDAGVTRILLVAGDSATGAGAFSSSVQALETGVFQACGIRSIGVAGYPEGHPRIPTQVLDEALERKIRYAEAHGIDLFIVTQFCFDGRAVLDWVRRLRERGIGLPVRVGVAGPATARTLLFYAMRCGIGASMKALGSGPVSLNRLLDRQGPERLVATIGRHADGLGITGLHVFPFGGFAESARWIADVAAGRFSLGERDEDIALTG